MNHHVRYVLPVVPYVYILAAGLLVRVGPWRVLRAVVGSALFAWAVASSLLVYPHSLSYFNEFAGGPAGGIYHLNNSNIDWGQDLLLLRDWQRRHADRPIFLAYFGRVNPKHAGIECQLPPMVSAEGVRESVPPLQPGWYAVSVTLLQGRAYMVHEPEGRWRGCPEDAFGYFRTMKPVERVGHSIYLYHVAPVEPPLNPPAGRTALRAAAT